MLAQNAGGDSHLSRQELSAAIYGLASMCLLVRPLGSYGQLLINPDFTHLTRPGLSQ